MIYCIGDSHISFFSGNEKMVEIYPIYSGNYIQYIKGYLSYIFYTLRNQTFDKYEYIKTYRIGAVLAYSLNKQKTTLKGREKIFRLLKKIPAGSMVLFSFGEIDCRAHIQKQAKRQQVEVSKVIDETVKVYGEFLDEVQMLGYHIYVWNAIPNIGNFISEEFPAIGTLEERMNIVNEFNNKVKNFCKNSEKNFITITDELLDIKNKLDKKYYIDNIHLSQSAIQLLKSKYVNDFDFGLKKGKKYNGK